MRTLTIAALTTLHADRSAHGPGRAPSIAECLDAARAGRLYDVDTQSAGYDGLSIGDDADDVIAEWAEACGVESPRGWTAERVGLAEAEDYVHRCDRSVVAYGETVEGGAYVLSPGAGSALTRAEYESACAAIEATQWPDDGRVSVMTPPSAYLTSNTDADDAGRVLAARRRAGIEAEAAR